MNANTRLRLWKEARALLPMWAAVYFFMGATMRLDRMDALLWSWLAYVFGSALLGAAVVGQEFQHRTMSTLMAQPVPRTRIWHEKLVILGTALLGLLLWFTLLVYAQWSDGNPRFRSEADAFAAACIWLAPLLLAFCTSPTFALLTRSTIGGVTLTSLCPVALFLGSGWLLPEEFSSPRRWVISAAYYASVFGIYACLLMFWGRRRFHRLEDNRSQPQELRFPTVQELRVKWTGVLFVLGVRRSPIPLATNHLQVEKVTTSCEQSATPLIYQPTRSSQRSSLEHLVRKEIRLQQPAIVVAVCLVALWLMLLAGVTTRLITDKGFLILPSILLGLGIPVLVGVVSTAEERGLGVHEWHLTLPVSARRLWTVKVLVALSVNAVLGLVLPGLLAHASSWLAKNSQLVADIAGSDLSPFRTVNLILISAALYTSTASANSMRALIGTIVLFLVGAMVLNFADFVVHSNSSLLASWSPREWRTDSFTMVVWLYQSRWPLVWAGLAAWLFVLGLTSYRRSLESVWQPVRRMIVFFAVVCAFVFAAIVW